MRLVLLTVAALIGFAGNSLLTRAALGAGDIDAAAFTGVRLATGAAALALLARLRSRPADATADAGSWHAALALAAYAVFFTIAYLRIGAGVGALVLFGGVQVTMIGTGLVRGERPARIDWAGVVLAAGGLGVLTLPGATAPDPLGTGLMALAGVCWGVYSLIGRRNRDPLGATAGNFLRATAFGALFVAISWAALSATPRGLVFAAISGSLASGVAYTLWYAALPHLQAWRAAILQLAVPILTALGATAWLGESITSRLALAAALVAAGVTLTVVPAWHRDT